MVLLLESHQTYQPEHRQGASWAVHIVNAVAEDGANCYQTTDIG